MELLSGANDAHLTLAGAPPPLSRSNGKPAEARLSQPLVTSPHTTCIFPSILHHQKGLETISRAISNSYLLQPNSSSRVRPLPFRPRRHVLQGFADCAFGCAGVWCCCSGTSLGSSVAWEQHRDIISLSQLRITASKPHRLHLQLLIQLRDRMLAPRHSLPPSSSQPTSRQRSRMPTSSV